MKYYTSGEFAKKANITIRTIRYYDKEGILKASMTDEKGRRFYTDEDFLRLQKILSLKLLGFSLNEIADMTFDDNMENTIDSFKIQLDLLEKKMDHLIMVKHALSDTIDVLNNNKKVEWSEIVNLIHLTNNEHSLIEQYKNSRNLNIRIDLHKRFSQGKKSWFHWILDHMDMSNADNILEIGCGNGQFWVESDEKLFINKKIYLSDISSGMIEDAIKNIGDKYPFQIKYQTFNCEQIPYDNNMFDIIMANHMLFYVKNIHNSLKECQRVLSEKGVFYCTTYGEKHMREIRELVNEFDDRIKLSNEPLYEKFGLANGKEILKKYFSIVDENIYNDYLIVDKVDPLVNYILSCHGNQSEILHKRQDKFKEFIASKIRTEGFIKISKEAVLFSCKK